jgi:hypothetical protein
MLHIETPDRVAAVVDESIRWFAAHGLDVAAELTVAADPVAVRLLTDAIADGFTAAMAMPSASWQQAQFSALVRAFGHHPDWDEPTVDVAGGAPTGRPTGPYLLLVHHDPRTDDDLRGVTAPALRRLLGSDTCVTVGEYLVLQRALFEHHGDHRFDDYQGEPPGWMWLADTTIGERTAMAYWYGPKRRIEITACKTGSKNPRKGARRTRIVPLG